LRLFAAILRADFETGLAAFGALRSPEIQFASEKQIPRCSPDDTALCSG
jgi:hypothetical protein